MRGEDVCAGVCGEDVPVWRGCACVGRVCGEDIFCVACTQKVNAEWIPIVECPCRNRTGGFKAFKAMASLIF